METNKKRVVLLTGAGVSAASGLPTYRGEGGLWGSEAVAKWSRAPTLERDPDGVWAYWSSWRQAVRQAKPNPAHLAIAALEERAQVHLVTQNVDGLHGRAGSLTHELHGAIRRTRCTGCARPSFEDDTVSSSAPRCERCGEALRVDVVLFGEHPDGAVEYATKRAIRECELFLAVGTSGTVWPASSFVRGADYAGARTILVNLERPEPANPYFHEVELGRAEEILPGLLARLMGT